MATGTPLNEDFPESAPARTQRSGGLTWGKVVKGVAVVTAIAVVAVVGYVALSALATWAVGTSVGAGALSAAAPVATGISSAAGTAMGYIAAAPQIIGAFFSSAFGLGAGGAGVSLGAGWARGGDHAAMNHDGRPPSRATPGLGRAGPSCFSASLEASAPASSIVSCGREPCAAGRRAKRGEPTRWQGS